MADMFKQSGLKSYARTLCAIPWLQRKTPEVKKCLNLIPICLRAVDDTK